MTACSRDLDQTSVTPAEDVRTIALNRVSWGAVLAGVVVLLVVQLLLNLLGLGIGVATLEPTGTDNPSVGVFSTAAAIWYAVAGIIAAYAGGYVAGRMSGRSLASTTALHGFTSWAVATLVMFWLLTTALSGIVGGVFSGVSGAVGGLGKTAATVARTAAPGVTSAADPFANIERQLREATGASDPAALREAATAALRAALTGDQAQAQEARERAARAIAKSRDVSIEDARAAVTQYEQQYRQAVEQTKQQALQAAATTAKVVSTSALLGFLALVLAAIAAFFGGWSGTVTPVVTDLSLSAIERRVS